MIKWQLFLNTSRIEFISQDAAYEYRKLHGLGGEPIIAFEEPAIIEPTEETPDPIQPDPILNQDKYARRSEFGKFLMVKMGRLNDEAGINLDQANWFIYRLRNTQLTTGEVSKQVNIQELLERGMLETAYVAITQMAPDDFTETYHWVTADILNQTAYEIAHFLGWV